jgi:hypothetical protein
MSRCGKGGSPLDDSLHESVAIVFIQETFRDRPAMRKVFEGLYAHRLAGLVPPPVPVELRQQFDCLLEHFEREQIA